MILPLPAYVFEFDRVLENIPLFIKGASLTLQICAVTIVLAFVIGLIAGQARMARSPLIRLPAAAYIDFFRATPVLVQLVWIFFLLPVFFGLRVGALPSGILALGLNYGAFFAEVFRAGVTSLDRGQSEAAFALGMTQFQALRRIIYPQALRRMLPPIGSLLVALLKDTSLLSVLGIAELTNTASQVGSQTFRQVEALTVVAVMYFVLAYPIAMWANWMHRRVQMSLG